MRCSRQVATRLMTLLGLLVTGLLAVPLVSLAAPMPPPAPLQVTCGDRQRHGHVLRSVHVQRSQRSQRLQMRPDRSVPDSAVGLLASPVTCLAVRGNCRDHERADIEQVRAGDFPGDRQLGHGHRRRESWPPTYLLSSFQRLLAARSHHVRRAGRGPDGRYRRGRRSAFPDFQGPVQERRLTRRSASRIKGSAWRSCSADQSPSSAGLTSSLRAA